MTANLFSANTPASFWCCLADLPEEQWQSAVEASMPVLEIPGLGRTLDILLKAVLGEGQFGDDHWTLGPSKRLYYLLKPVLPRSLTRRLRQLLGGAMQADFPLGWPIEDRYVRFQWAVMRHLMTATGQTTLPFVHFWPEGRRFAFVLTHDVETMDGLAQVRRVAELEASLGFRASFNFVPERYPLDHGLLRELREGGFEIGVHGLLHDGKLFGSLAEFTRRSKRINGHLQELGARGFRAPLTHRQPEWMQALDIDYDLSFFDSDPFEPIPGGTMSIWPFQIGHFTELPYTLAQDYTLTRVLGETTPRLWLQKVDFLERYCGLVLVNTHPDYLLDAATWTVYADFLQSMVERGGYWHALPGDAARWWRARSSEGAGLASSQAVRGRIRSTETGITLELE